MHTIEKLYLGLVSGVTTITMEDVNNLRLAAGYAPIWTRGQDSGEA